MIAATNPRFLHWVENEYKAEHIGLKASTLLQYVITARQLELAAGRTLRTRDLQRRTAVEFRSWLAQEGRSNETIASKWNNLRVLWKYAHKLGLTDEAPPDLPPIKCKKRTPKALRLEQMEALITAAYLARPGRGWEGRHWVALLMVIYDTGLRIGVILKLRTTQLCLERGVLRTEPEQEKDGEGLMHTLHPQTIAALQDAIESPRHLVFPWPYSKRLIWDRYEDILVHAKILEPNATDAERRRKKFHMIRRTSASWLESVRPGAATAHLGHSDRATTVKSYIDPEIAGTQVNAAEALPRFKVEQPKADRDGQMVLFQK